MAVRALRSGSERRDGLNVVERHRLGNGHTVAVLLDHVQHPLAECLGHRGAGEHGEEVAAAQAEDAGFLRTSFRGQRDHSGHCGGEFVGVAGVEFTDGNISVFTVSKGRTNLVPPYLKQRTCDMVNLFGFLIDPAKKARAGS